MRNFHRLSQLLFSRGIETKHLDFAMRTFLSSKEVTKLFKEEVTEEELEVLADRIYLSWRV